MSPDPFDALRVADVPVPPTPAFAADLRARLTDVLAGGSTRGVPVTATSSAPAPSGLVPYLALSDTRAALAWYADVFGAAVVGQPLTWQGDRIGHAEMEIGGSRLYLSDDNPEIGVVAPVPGLGSSVTLHLEVDDVDALVTRCAGAGATVARPAADAFYGRNAVVIDPFGHRWLLMSPAPMAPSYPRNGLRPGDVSYVTLQVPDLAAAQAFYSTVLGWTYGPGHVPYGAQVLGTTPMIGLWGDPAVTATRVGAVLGYRVDDIRSAVAAVTAGGGSAGEVTTEPYGLAAQCVDSQGLGFYLHQMDDHPVVPDGARLHEGDVSYVTLGVTDGGRDRAFYAAVLGWAYEDGNPVGLLPRTGMWSPADHKVAARQDEWTQTAGAVLCYQVEDIAAAVDRLRAAGGRCDDPQQRPYGLEIHGYDNQGIELYLHQLTQ
ncbi:MAG TPA: VOC family protein [Mycobacteriales bacterium]